MKRVILLSGSTGKLGWCFVQRYGKEYNIAGVARSAERNNGGHFLIEADITKDVDRIVDETLKQFGQIDLLINNAVFYEWNDIKDCNRKSLNKQFNVNVVSPLLLAAKVYKKFWSTDKYNCQFNRNIVNVSSISAINVYAEGQVGYAASKAALNTATLHLASEFAKCGIRANAICPNGFPSFIPTEKVADAIVEMDKSSLTGRIKVIDTKDYFV